MKFRLVKIQEQNTVTVFFNNKWISINEALHITRNTTLISKFKHHNLLISASTDMLFLLQNYKKLKDDLLLLLHSTKTLNLQDYTNEPSLLPFKPKSLRDASLWEKHMIDSARGLVKYAKPFSYPLIKLYEWTTWNSFPMLKPKPIWYEKPIYYMGNHLNIYKDGDEIPYPSYTNQLDYELEIGIVIGQHVKNVDVKDAKDAIAGFVLFNDFSARDLQLTEMLDGRFGPTKTKNFANVLGPVVVTPEEIEFSKLKAQVFVNGKLVGKGTTENPQHTVEELIAYISMGENLYPGEVIGTGTVPGCTGIEVGVFLHEGDEVELKVEPFGSLKNKIGKKEKPNNWKSEKKTKLSWSPGFKTFILGLFIAFIAFLVFKETNIDPIAYTPKKRLSITDYEAPVYYIHNVEKIKLNASGPESIAFNSEGYLFTGLSDGTIRKIDVKTGESQVFARTSQAKSVPPLSECGKPEMEHLCGRPLGLRFDVNGDLVVADAYFGLLKITKDGNVTQLVSEYEGVPFKFTNDLAIATYDGAIYFTDTSTKFYRKDNVNDILEGRPNGRLFKYDPAWNQLTLLLDGLHFPNGVTFNFDESKLFIVETTRSRILSFHIKGETVGKVETFIDNLPCVPDNIRPFNLDKIAIACHCERSPVVDFIAKYPLLRKIFANLNDLFKGKIIEIAKKKSGTILFYSQVDGSMTDILYDPTGSNFRILSEIEEFEGFVYAGSITAPEIVRFPYHY